MKCQLCKEKDATKKNTHYLTDSIIRTNLNEDGSNKREKGAYFDMSNTNAFTEFNFQRGTSPEKIKEILGREPTEEEIEAAKEIPFSVDDTFCPDCENIFTQIESEFIQNVLPQITNDIAKDKEFIEVDENELTRRFFLMQVWRSAVCTSTFDISNKSKEKIRKILLENNTDYLFDFPLSITFLETIGDKVSATQNLVGLSSDRNPNLIFMNKFIIQFYDDENKISYLEFYGLNNEDNYREYINLKEDKFKVRVLNNEHRLKYQMEMLLAEKIRPMLANYRDNFVNIWSQLIGNNPSGELVEEFIQYIINGDETSILKYSKEKVMNKAAKFIFLKSNTIANRLE